MIWGNACTQCKPGYKLNVAKTFCISDCKVSNCLKCINGECSECKAGFSFYNHVQNGKTVQLCRLNPCTVGNCTYCNTTGKCITCKSGFILHTNGSCITNCTSISSCISCGSGVTSYCAQCFEPRSWNTTKHACESFSGTGWCKQHDKNCSQCLAGYTLRQRSCIPNCDSPNCSICFPADTSVCYACN